MVVAACPEATAIAPMPPSSAVIRSSSTAVVGLPEREYAKPSARRSKRARSAAWSGWA